MLLKKLNNLLSLGRTPVPNDLEKQAAIKYIASVKANKAVDLYQPNFNPKGYAFLREETFIRGGTKDRLEFISQAFDYTEIGSYCDVGSQFGYFVYELSKRHNLLGYGLEKDPISHQYALALGTLAEVSGISLTCIDVTAEVVEKLPRFDLISILNVYHHLVYFSGREEADNIVRSLVRKCRHFVFETGQYDEQGYYWSKGLAFMGENPEQWIREFLEELGLELVAEKRFPTHLSDKARLMVCCQGK